MERPPEVKGYNFAKRGFYYSKGNFRVSFKF